MKPDDFSNTRVLVTGGAGFIGSALVWALNRRGCDDIVVCDRLGTDEKWRNLTPLRFADYIEADDLLRRLQDGSLGKFDLVLHLGACSSTTERDATFLVRNNYEFTRDLAMWALGQKGRTRKTRFVYASSAATYGDGSAGMEDDNSCLNTLRPMNMYGYSKHLFDLHAAQAGFLDQIVGLKYFNVFGPNEDHKGEMRSLVHKSFGQVRDTGSIRLFKSYRPDYGDGEQKRDFLYVKDAVAMTLHLAATPEAGGLFNIGSGAARTWMDLATAVFTALQHKPNIQFIEMPETIRDKYQYFTQANLGRLRAAGYKASITSLEDAVGDYVRNYLVPDKRLDPLV
jgi:ADP-L-glycero-D-manno-heptose 6-epimerase